MATSKLWKGLKREIEGLRKDFLPAAFDPLGEYDKPRRVQAHTRAFLVLSHAEIESYLEVWAKEIARACEKVWTSSNRITEPMAFLLVTVSERIDVPETIVGPNVKDIPQRLAETSTKLFQRYYKRIKDNNGVKENNVLDLFGPLGLPSAALGATLATDLDNFGAMRGTHAHNSAKAVVNVLDPETEYNRVTSLVDDLTALDEWCVKCKRRIR